MNEARLRRPSALLLVAVALGLLVPAWLMPVRAEAALSAKGFAVRPMISTDDDLFSPSATGNPVTDGGLVAGSAEVGRYDHAAVYDLHRHTLRVLGTLGGRSSFGTDVNQSGDVVGYSEITFRGEVHAFLWTARTGVMHDLGAFGGQGSYSQANAISDAGVVVGWATYRTGDTAPRAFVWDPRATPVQMRALPLPTGARLSVATSVNTKGQVVGRAEGDVGSEGVLWDPMAARVDVLASPPGTQVLGAVDINEAGFVVGPAEVRRVGPYGPYATPRSYRWSPTTRTATLMVAPPGEVNQVSGGDEVRALNRHGIIVGVAHRDRVARLVVWNECGTPVYLQSAPGGQDSVGSGVNRYGEVVGTSSGSPNRGAVFVRAEPCTATP